MNKENYISSIKKVLTTFDDKFFPFQVGTKINLNYYGESLEHLCGAIYLNVSNEICVSTYVNDNWEYDCLTDFSTDEVKEIYDVFVKQINI